MDRTKFLCVPPIGLPHRSEGAQADPADRTPIIGSQILRKLDGPLEHLAVPADRVVQQAVPIRVVSAGALQRIKHSRPLGPSPVNLAAPPYREWRRFCQLTEKRYLTRE